VWVSELERPVLADIMSYMPRVPTSMLSAWPGFGPFESYEAEHGLFGGETLELADLEIEVLSTPGHTPGHLAFSISEAQMLLSGDLLYRGSVRGYDIAVPGDG
jgi:glyoxylase-like metal-dependent hydrolase (beta-lactamase superfamily II)